MKAEFSFQTSSTPKKGVVVLVHCLDPRFLGVVVAYAQHVQRVEQRPVELILRAGGAKCLASPTKPSHREALLDDLAVAYEHHGPCEFRLTTHVGCAAYGKQFESDDAEHTFHAYELTRARSIAHEELSVRFPGFTVPITTRFASWNGIFIPEDGTTRAA